MNQGRALAGVACTAALVLSGMAVATVASRGGDAVADKLRRFVLAAKERGAARPASREAAAGETVEGSAWVCYARASGLLAVLPAAVDFDWGTTTLTERGQPVSAQRGSELREAWGGALRELRAGAHCRDAHPHGASLAAAESWRCAKVLAAEFTCRIRGADLDGAVQTWLDAATLACDQQHGDMAPVAHGQMAALCSLWRDELLRGLGDAQAAALAAGLLALDGRLAVVPDPLELLAAMAGRVLDEPVAERSVRQRLHAWRAGFDPRRQDLAGFVELLELAAQLSPPLDGWQERQAQWRRYLAAPRRHSTMWTLHADDVLQSAEQGRRRALFALRALRLAVAFHRGGPLESLADPFGAGSIAVHVDGAVAAFSCAAGAAVAPRLAARG